MTAYAFNADGWYTGTVPDDTPNSTPIEPPVLATDMLPGAPRSVWARSVWYVVAVPQPPLAVDLFAGDRLRMWEQIKAERDRRKSNGTHVAGKWFHSDADSRIQQLGLRALGASVPPVPWKTMDGSFVVMNEALAQSIFSAVLTNDMALFAHAEGLRQSVMNAPEPQTVNIMAGWPETFGG